MLIEAEQRTSGRIDAGSGAATRDDSSSPEVDELLDGRAELVHKNGGKVVIAEAERMPAPGGPAAIYRN